MEHTVFLRRLGEERDPLEFLVRACIERQSQFILFDVVGDWSDGLKGLRKPIPLYEPGTFQTGALSVNPFELLPGVPIHRHLATVSALFAKIFGFQELEAQAFRSALTALYQRFDWDPITDQQRRIDNRFRHGDMTMALADYYAPEIFPTLSDVMVATVDVLNKLELPEHKRQALRSRVRHSIEPLLQGKNEYIFGCSTRLSIEEMLTHSSVVNVSVLANERERALLVGTIAMFAEELAWKQSQREEPHSGVLFVDSIELCAPLFRYVPHSTFKVDLQEEDSAGTHYLPHTLRRLKRQDVTVIAMCESENFLADLDKQHFAIMDSADPPLLERLAEELPTSLRGADFVREVYGQEPYISAGYGYWPEAFKPDILEDARRIAEDAQFYDKYLSFLLAVQTDIWQIVAGRATLVNEIQRLKRSSTRKVVELCWVVLSLASDRYFREKARFHAWSLAEEHLQRETWYRFLHAAFMPSQISRRVDVSELRAWRDDLVRAQQRDVGPLLACTYCRVPCRYGHEASLFASDEKLMFDFNCSINRPETPASENVAWFATLRAERVSTQRNIDLAYCMAANFLDKELLSADAQLVLMQKARNILDDPAFHDGIAYPTPPAPSTPEEEASSGSVVLPFIRPTRRKPPDPSDPD